jgi:chromosome segregation ATPase
MNDEKESLRLENRRLIVENNQLHQQALRNGEIWKKKEFESEEFVKQLKKQLHESLSINNLLVHQKSALENEFNALKRRWEHYLSSENRNLTTADEQLNNEKKLTLLKKQSIIKTNGLEASDGIEQNNQVGNEEFMNLTELVRVRSEELERKLAEYKSEKSKILELEQIVKLRDNEISRLTVLVEGTGGRTIDVINSDYTQRTNADIIEQLKEEIAFLHNQLDTAHEFKMNYDDLKEVKTEKSSMEKKLKEYERKNQELTIELNELQRSILTNKRQSTQQDERSRVLQEKFKSAEIRLSQRDEEVDQLKTLLIELDRTRWILEEDLRAYQQEAGFSNKKANEAFKQHEDLHKKLAEKQEKIETLQRSINSLDAKVDEVSAQLDDREIKLAKITDSHQTLETQNETMRRELNDSQIRIEKQLQQLQENERQIKNLKQQIGDLSTDNNNVKQENRLNKQEMHNVADDLTRLRQENQFLHGQSNKFNADIERLQRQLENTTGDMLHYKQTLGAKDEEVADIIENYKSLNVQLTQSKDTIQLLEHDITEAKIQLSLKLEEEHRLTSRVQELEDENHRLLMELKSIQHQTELISKQNVAYAERIQVIEDEKEHLMRDFSDSKIMNVEAEKKRNESRNEAVQLRIELEHLNIQLKELEAQKNNIEQIHRQEQAKLYDLEKIVSEMNVQLLCSSTAEKEFKIENEHLRHRVDELESGKKLLSEQLKRYLLLEKETQERQSQYETMIRNVKDLSFKHEEQLKIINNQKRDIEILQQNLRHTEEALDRALTEMNQLNTSRNSDAHEIETLKGKNRELKGKNQTLLLDNQRLHNLLK